MNVIAILAICYNHVGAPSSECLKLVNPRVAKKKPAAVRDYP